MEFQARDQTWSNHDAHVQMTLFGNTGRVLHYETQTLIANRIDTFDRGGLDTSRLGKGDFYEFLIF